MITNRHEDRLNVFLGSINPSYEYVEDFSNVGIRGHRKFRIHIVFRKKNIEHAVPSFEDSAVVDIAIEFSNNIVSWNAFWFGFEEISIIGYMYSGAMVSRGFSASSFDSEIGLNFN